MVVALSGGCIGSLGTACACRPTYHHVSKCQLDWPRWGFGAAGTRGETDFFDCCFVPRGFQLEEDYMNDGHCEGIGTYAGEEDRVATFRAVISGEVSGTGEGCNPKHK
jgi:hypothetical protein